jgi:hypothetical protein
MSPRASTHEPELTRPRDLCTPDGRRLDQEAVGWSRTPLLTANLAGVWGRTKRWDYWAILTEDLVIALTYADVDYLGIVAVWWCDLTTGEAGGRDMAVPLARGIELPDRPGTAPLTYRSPHLGVELVDDAGGTTLTARWRERDGRIGRLDAHVALPAGHESVNVVIPWSPTRFQYTSKHQARPATGTLRLGDEERAFGGGPGQGGGDRQRAAWGVLDVGRGRWPYRTRWNWGGGAGHAEDGRVVGLQVGGKWTEGTPATENGVIVDGVVRKVGQELTWEYDWGAPLEPWRVHAADGSLDATLTPTYDRHDRIEAGILGTEVHQVFGTWRGRAIAPDGSTVEFDELVGFAEESRSRW